MIPDATNDASDAAAAAAYADADAAAYAPAYATYSDAADTAARKRFWLSASEKMLDLLKSAPMAEAPTTRGEKP